MPEPSAHVADPHPYADPFQDVMPHPPSPARRPRRRAVSVAVGLLGVAAMAVPSAATAGQSLTPNTCKYSSDGFWRNIDVRVASTAAPVYVPPGAGFRLTGTTAATRLPDWIPEFAFNTGLMDPGVNDISADVWLAVQGAGTAQGSQILHTQTTARTTITASPDGEQFRGATPLDVVVPFPDSTWTAPTLSDGQPYAQIDFQQGPNGTLPELPPRATGGDVTRPTGSLYIRARIKKTVFDLDCRPGRYVAPEGTSFTPGKAERFEVAYADPSAADTGIAPPPVASPDLRLRSTTLRRYSNGTKAAVRLTNPGVITSTSQVRVVSSGKLKLRKGRKAQRVTFAKWSTVTVGAGKNGSLALKLSKDVRNLLKQRKSIKVRVSLRSATGEQTASGADRWAKSRTFTATLRR
ncbi:MAG: hypothetical protein M0P31_12385 [Solirubrobacteraceae bacterium]|nr:hypothetical protein [Solirubrobacteraceae bacterium]